MIISQTSIRIHKRGSLCYDQDTLGILYAILSTNIIFNETAHGQLHELSPLKHDQPFGEPSDHR